MGRTACTEPQCLYKGALYLFFTFMNFMSLTDISAQESKVLSPVQTSAVSVVTVGAKLYGVTWNEKNFEGSRRILYQNLPGVNQFMKNPGKDSQRTEHFKLRYNYVKVVLFTVRRSAGLETSSF